MESECKFSIGDAEIKCNKNIGEKQDVLGGFLIYHRWKFGTRLIFAATFENIKKDESRGIKYEKYEITPKKASDPVRKQLTHIYIIHCDEKCDKKEAKYQ